MWRLICLETFCYSSMYNPLTHNATFWRTEDTVYNFGKHCDNQFLLFSQCFLPHMVLIFHSKCHLQFISMQTSWTCVLIYKMDVMYLYFCDDLKKILHHTDAFNPWFSEFVRMKFFSLSKQKNKKNAEKYVYRSCVCCF